MLKMMMMMKMLKMMMQLSIGGICLLMDVVNLIIIHYDDGNTALFISMAD